MYIDLRDLTRLKKIYCRLVEIDTYYWTDHSNMSHGGTVLWLGTLKAGRLGWLDKAVTVSDRCQQTSPVH